MRDHDQRSSLAIFDERLVDEFFAFHINLAGRFVEN